MSQVLSQFRPPDSESNVHVNQLHRGQHIIQKPNKAIKRQTIGENKIIESVPAPVIPAPNLKATTPIIKPPAKKKASKTREFTKTITLESESLSRRSPSPPKESRPSSPLRPPNFYNVRLSNAPIFLRRTTVRPPSLNFLDRRSASPKRVASPTRSRPESRVEFKVVEKALTARSEHEPELNDTKAQINIVRSNVQENNVNQTKSSVSLMSNAVQIVPSRKDEMTQVTPVLSEQVSQVSEVIQTLNTSTATKLKQHLEKAIQKASIETQYSSPNRDASCQYSLTSEKSEYLEIQFDNTQAKKSVTKDPEYNRLVEEESDLSTNLEAKIANWIQNEVLLRMLTKEENPISFTLPMSTQMAPEKQDVEVQMIAQVEAGTQATDYQTFGPATLTSVEVPSIQTMEMIIQTDPVPEIVEALSPEKSAIIEEIPAVTKAPKDSYNLEEALFAKLNEEAANRARFLEELEKQRTLDAAEREKMRQTAENEKKQILDEIQKLREEAKNKSFQEAEEKIQSFMSWQNNIELALTRVENNQSPTKLLLESREIQTQLETKPQVEEKIVQSDKFVVETHDAAEQVSVSSIRSLEEPVEESPKISSVVLENAVETDRQEPSKRKSSVQKPLLIGVGKEIIYEQTSRNLTEVPKLNFIIWI